MRVVVVIPALNEESSIAHVIEAIPQPPVERIIVVNNGSSDRTAEIARRAGATVVDEPRQGYGRACRRGIEEAGSAEIVVFLDADFSDDPSCLPDLIEPILRDEADLIIGSRILGHREKGALPLHARLGNRLACFLLYRLFGIRFTDLGPFRAIRRSALEQLGMRDATYGWTVEMQAKAVLHTLRCGEVPVPYRRRIGRSKISGTVLGSLKAGSKILSTLILLWLKRQTLTRTGPQPVPPTGTLE